MIILDTNVISELMRSSDADHRVIGWVRALEEQPVTTVINRAEILAGVALLPAGTRRDRLRVAAEAALGGLGVCLPLVTECGPEYAEIVAARRGTGRPIGAMDALIASIARVSGASVATRDIDGFSGLGVDLIDPWTAAV